MLNDFFEIYFSPRGRWNRLRFYMYAFPMGCLVAFYELAFETHLPRVINTIFYLLFGYIGFIVHIKRAHDRGKPGIFALLMLMPILNIWPTIELYFLKGEKGKNAYGEDPLREDTKTRPMNEIERQRLMNLYTEMPDQQLIDTISKDVALEDEKEWREVIYPLLIEEAIRRGLEEKLKGIIKSKENNNKPHPPQSKRAV